MNLKQRLIWAVWRRLPELVALHAIGLKRRFTRPHIGLARTARRRSVSCVRRVQMRGGQHGQGRSPSRLPSSEIRGPIDLEHLGRQTLGDPGLEQEVLRLFDEMSHDLLRAARNQHHCRRSRCAISTRSSGAAAGVGAFGLAEPGPGRRGRTARRRSRSIPSGSTISAMAVQEVSAFITERLKRCANGRITALPRACLRAPRRRRYMPRHAKDHLHRSQRQRHTSRRPRTARP